MKHIPAFQALIKEALDQHPFKGEPQELYDPMDYLMGLGGKRLRPALCLAGCELFGGAASEALSPALGIEVFHNFSLVHDDIMDQADLRRGKATVHKKWNTNIAILAGDAMLVRAYQLMAEVKPALLPEILATFSQTALEVCEGQQRDMNFELREMVSGAEYLEMIQGKTAVLLGAAIKIGALIGGAQPDSAQALYDFGIYAGLAFQVQDDLLDAYGDPDKFGKTVGGDILQDKKTWLMIHAAEEDAEGLKSLQAKGLSGAEKVAAYKAFFESSGAKSETIKQRDQLLKQALDALDAAHAPNQELKRELATFATWLAERDH